jgi:DNA-binding MarR family transcriptional regulator
MERKLRQELKQSKPFASPEQEVVLEIQRTAQVVMRWVAEGLKPSGLTPQQFNVLRILRGASPNPLSASQICERMVTYDPDLTRLLDRLEAAGMVRKERHADDRRVVNVHVTAAGRETVERASVAVSARIGEALRGIGETRLGELADLLELVRGNTP